MTGHDEIASTGSLIIGVAVAGGQVAAIVIGVMLAALLFTARMSDTVAIIGPGDDAPSEREALQAQPDFRTWPARAGLVSLENRVLVHRDDRRNAEAFRLSREGEFRSSLRRDGRAQ